MTPERETDGLHYFGRFGVDAGHAGCDRAAGLDRNAGLANTECPKAAL